MIDTQGRTEKEPKALNECPTLRAQAHGNVPMIVASRGRNPQNPSDRTAGAPTEQRLEGNTQGTSNCLTSVGKDNMVLKNEMKYAEGRKLIYRIRKLTPLECFRLMGLSDSDYKKVKAMGVSNTSLYKIAGNGIVTNCVQFLAEHLYKAQYDDSFKCYDEGFTRPQAE